MSYWLQVSNKTCWQQLWWVFFSKRPANVSIHVSSWDNYRVKSFSSTIILLLKCEYLTHLTFCRYFLVTMWSLICWSEPCILVVMWKTCNLILLFFQGRRLKLSNNRLPQTFIIVCLATKSAWKTNNPRYTSI